MLLHLPHFDVEEACFRKSLFVEYWQVLQVRHFLATAGQVMWQVASDHVWCKGLALCMIVIWFFVLTYTFCQRYHWPHKESVFLKQEGELRHGCYFSTASGWACSAWANLVVSSCGAWSPFVVNSLFWCMRGIWKESILPVHRKMMTEILFSVPVFAQRPVKSSVKCGFSSIFEHWKMFQTAFASILLDLSNILVAVTGSGQGADILEGFGHGPTREGIRWNSHKATVDASLSRRKKQPKKAPSSFLKRFLAHPTTSVFGDGGS